ncbi:MAG: condensation domain-containing protein, partial [Segetibacter sp.]
VNRHEVLRTVYNEEDGQAYQYIKDKDQWQFSNTEVANKDDSNALREYIGQFVNTPFDLTKDDMLRAGLIKFSDKEHILVVTLHHIAFDGWSISIFVRELVELYHSFTEGTPNSLALPEIQYADYAIWQRHNLLGEILNKKISYWKNKLTDVKVLNLPTDFVRPVVQSTKGATLAFTVEKDLRDGLYVLSQQSGATLFMTLLSAFKVLLYRYTNQQDICVGTGVAGRQNQEVEGLIGLFVNMLALRSNGNADGSFFDLLQQVTTTTLEAYENQEVPFEKVVEAVVKERERNRTPLFQVIFVLQNTPEVQKLQLGEVDLSEETFQQDISKFDISFFVTETDKGLQGSIEYCTDLYSAETIESMLRHYKQLLTSIVKNPQQKVSALKMLGEAEQDHLLCTFNNTSATYPLNKSVIDLFEEQVLQTPHATALIFEEEQITFSELNRRANRLAYELRGKGVKEETLVPLCIDRSVEM